MAKNELRIISGKWGGRKLRFTDRPQLRPTLGRARETLFNWLGTDLSGRRCLDLFAGSGALGFEAASRSADFVQFVEKDRLACSALRANAETLGASNTQVACMEAGRFLRSEHSLWDLVFLDPPFRSPLLGDTLSMLVPHLAANAIVYWEANEPPALPAGLVARKQQRAGDSWYGLADLESG
jgi:16S rRNA (guanine966-N2)-methyltransferase